MEKRNIEIYVRYCYSSGTFGTPVDGALRYNDQKIAFKNKEEAQKYINYIGNCTYYLSHGEQGRPEMIARKIRKDTDLNDYILFTGDEAIAEL